MANIGNQQLPVTSGHVDEILSQRRQINEFINKDKERDSWDRKYYLTVGLIFILIISCLVIFTYPEYFTQVLSLIIGGFGGFGLGTYMRRD
jgi:polyferredoxin